MNSISINEFLHYPEGLLNFDSSFLGYFLPIFEEKLGSSKPIQLELSFRDMNFKFGDKEADADIDLDYILRLRVFDYPR